MNKMFLLLYAVAAFICVIGIVGIFIIVQTHANIINQEWFNTGVVVGLLTLPILIFILAVCGEIANKRAETIERDDHKEVTD